MKKEKEIPKFIVEAIDSDMDSIKFLDRSQCSMPDYNPISYTADLSQTRYFDVLITLRHYVQLISQYFFAVEQGAKQVDLFMMTSSVSSPMGPGSDSEPIEIFFGGLETNLVDSSQFGFEPLLLNGLKKVYCYLPSMRGEDPDRRHLNQFFHSELEIVGCLDDVMQIAEQYVRRLAEVLNKLQVATDLISNDPTSTHQALDSILAKEPFPRITFDDAFALLSQQPNSHRFVTVTEYGRDISAAGEIELLHRLGNGYVPVWVTHYDRDRVPFYQKPSISNPDKVENADLLLPPLTKDSFGGEVLGAGQRQDSVKEIFESLKRQKNIPSEPYKWYIDLRRSARYQTTSGFGLGIERFLAWSLCKSNIRDVSLYPRIKGIKTYP